MVDAVAGEACDEDLAVSCEGGSVALVGGREDRRLDATACTEGGVELTGGEVARDAEVAVAGADEEDLAVGQGERGADELAGAEVVLKLFFLHPGAVDANNDNRCAAVPVVVVGAAGYQDVSVITNNNTAAIVASITLRVICPLRIDGSRVGESHDP